MSGYRKEVIPAGGEGYGETTYIKWAEQTPGTSFTGIFKKALTKEFINKKTKEVTVKKTYFLKQSDGTELGLNGAKVLDERMDLVAPGSNIEVLYEGQGKKDADDPMRKPPFLFKVFNIGTDESAASDATTAPQPSKPSALDKVKKSA